MRQGRGPASFPADRSESRLAPVATAIRGSFRGTANGFRLRNQGMILTVTLRFLGGSDVCYQMIFKAN